MILFSAFYFLSSLAAQPQTIEIVCRKSFFTPSEVRIKQGTATRLSIRSEDVTHGFAIDALGIAREVAPGQPVVVKINADQPGRYEYYCVVRCGRDHLKMRGVLIVE